MKSSLTKVLWTGALGAALLCPAVHAQEVKIGYVDVVKVLEQAPQGEAVLKKLKTEFDPRDQALKSLDERVKSLEDDLVKNILVLKDSERQEQEKEIRNLKRRIKRETQEFREELRARQNEELNELQKIVFKAIVDTAKTEKFDLVIHEGVVFASDRLDITDKILKALEKEAGGAE